MAIAISYTAPRFSESDLKEEQDALTEIERDEIEADVNGMCAIRHETKREQKRWRDQVQQELDKMPVAEIEEYLEALRECPDLVQMETDIMRFVRAEDYNVKAAAQRLVCYWKARKDAFGVNAFRPLLLEGGALDPAEVDMLRRHKSLCIMPKDEMGRTVLWFVREKYLGTNPVPLVRTLLYLVNVACEEEEAQKHGFVLVLDLNGLGSGDFNRKQCAKFHHLIGQCLPMRVRAYHLCFPALKCVPLLFLPSILWLMGKNLRLRSRNHFGGPKELAIDLQDSRFRRSGLPEQMGGTYSKADHDAWINEREKKEARSLVEARRRVESQTFASQQQELKQVVESSDDAALTCSNQTQSLSE